MTDFTKKGCCIGFTVKGESVTGCYRTKAKAWTIDLWIGDVCDLSRRRSFGAKEEAVAYADTVIDLDATRRLAWWKVEAA
jgi:hypothetical protein